MERNVLALTSSAVLALAIGTALADPSYLQFITSSLLAIPAFNYCYDSPFCTVSQKTISKLASKPQGVPGAWPTDATHSGSKSDPATRSNDELDRKRVDSACDVAIRPPSSREDEESRAHTRNVNGVAGNFKDHVSESRRLTTKVLVPEVTAPSPRYLEETEFLKRLAEMESEHSRTVESIQKIHKDEIVRIGSEHASQLETLHSQISKANFKISAQRFAMNENLDRIKTEHEAELKRFRESETGRLAEMETVHSRNIESIRKIHEGEIIQIRSEHGTMLETLNSHISDASSKISALEAERFVMNEKFDRVRAEHEVELKQIRETEVSGRLAEMETVHSRDVESIRKTHEDQIVRIRSEHAAQLETYNSQISDASSKISALEAERFVMNEKIDRIRTEHEAELKRFQESSDQALKQEELKSAELLQRLDEQRQHIENELTAGSVTGKENDEVQDSKNIELENRIAELERELETSAEKHQQALEAAQFEYSFILAQVENDQRRHVTETNYLKFQIDELQKNVSSAVETAVLESQRSNQEKLKEERQRFEATMGALMDKVEMFARRG